MKEKIKENISGVYTITNIINNKIYVGSSINCINSRFNSHINSLKHNKHHNKHLQLSFNKYGEESFVFEILEKCDPIYSLSQEQYWMNMLCSLNKKYGYNICPVAGNTKGVKPSKETREKIRKSQTGISKAKNLKSFSRITKVKQLDYNLNIIRDNITIREISEELKINQESIIRCCKNRYRSAGGFIWRFENDTNEYYIPKTVNIKYDIKYPRFKANLILPEFNIFNLNT